MIELWQWFKIIVRNIVQINFLPAAPDKSFCFVWLNSIIEFDDDIQQISEAYNTKCLTATKSGQRYVDSNYSKRNSLLEMQTAIIYPRKFQGLP